jgi:hypothetical protein
MNPKKCNKCLIEKTIDSFFKNSSNEDELYKLCYFTNLQPMWATDNIKKGAKII